MYHLIEQAIDEYGTAVRRAESLLHHATKPGEMEKAINLVVIHRKRLNSLITEAMTQKARRT